MTHTVRPPGPENRGLLGNTPLRHPDPLAVYTQWAREYGDIYYYRNLHWDVYVLCHPDLIRDLLVTKGKHFVKGRAVQFSRPVFGNGLLTNEGEGWARQRKLIQPTFHKARIDGYAQTVIDSTVYALEGWTGEEPRDIHAEMMQLTLKIVSKVIFDLDDPERIARVSAAVNTTLELTSGIRLLLPPVLRKIPTPDNLRYLRAVRELDRIVYGLMEERRLQPGQGNDLLTMLGQVLDEDGQPMPDEQLRDEVMTMLLAGHETTATALSWTWFLLSQHPEVEAKLWAELGEVLGGSAPRVEDLKRLRYTESVVKESMRLLPPVWGLTRMAVSECEIGGYKIPAGATVIVSQWVTHRDPRFFTEPERFDPERWLRPEARTLPNFAYFPFGGGPRVCIGASFAMIEATLMLACIAQRFRLRLAPGCAVRPLATITLRPDRPMEMTATKRTGTPEAEAVLASI